MSHSVPPDLDPRATGVVIPQVLRVPGRVVAQMDVVIPSLFAGIAGGAGQGKGMALIGEFAPVAGATMGAGDAHLSRSVTGRLSLISHPAPVHPKDPQPQLAATCVEGLANAATAEQAIGKIPDLAFNSPAIAYIHDGRGIRDTERHHQHWTFGPNACDPRPGPKLLANHPLQFGREPLSRFTCLWSDTVRCGRGRRLRRPGRRQCSTCRRRRLVAGSKPHQEAHEYA